MSNTRSRSPAADIRRFLLFIFRKSVIYQFFMPSICAIGHIPLEFVGSDPALRNTRFRYTQRNSPWTPNTSSRLSQTCKKVRNEFCGIFFSRNTFHIYSEDDYFDLHPKFRERMNIEHECERPFEFCDIEQSELLRGNTFARFLHSAGQQNAYAIRDLVVEFLLMLDWDVTTPSDNEMVDSLNIALCLIKLFTPQLRSLALTFEINDDEPYGSDINLSLNSETEKNVEQNIYELLREHDEKLMRFQRFAIVGMKRDSDTWGKCRRWRKG